MDALSEILHSVKLDGAVFYNAEFTAPWGVRSPSSREVAGFLRKSSKHVIMYHFLTQGQARCEVEHSSHGLELVPGDVVVFPHGDAHIMSNGCPSCIVDNGKQLKEVFSQGMALATVEEATLPCSSAALWSAIGSSARCFWAGYRRSSK